MLQLYDVIKHAVLQQLPKAETHPQLPEIPGMNRCQHPNPRTRNLPYRFQLRLPPQLVHRHDLRIHHSHQQRHALILGTAGQHIGAGAQIQRVFPLPLGCQLPALIYHPDSNPLGAQLPDQVPEKCGFSSPGR